MFSNLMPYSAYVDAEVAQIPEVPVGWSVRRLKVVCRLNYGDALSAGVRNSGDVPVMGSNGRIGWHDCANTVGDTIVVGRKGSFGKVVFSARSAFVVDTAYYVDQRSTSADTRWLFYALKWLRLDVASRDSAIPGLDREEAYARLLPVPPLAEQRTIGKYLAHAHRRIDRAIVAKLEMIALLEEQKRAVISDAVIRGVDGGGPMMASPVPWIAEVRRHWTFRKLRGLFRHQGSGTTPPDDGDYGGGIPWLMSGELQDGIVTSTRRTVTQEAVERISSLRVFPAGALVIAMYGATIGRTGVLAVPAATNQACCVFHGPLGVSVPYVRLAVEVSKPGLLTQAFGGGQPNVNAEVVKQLRIPVPPLEEQHKIVEFVDAESSHSNTAVDRARREIELLEEFRTRLTADVVTGQLDVREIAAGLPAIDPSEVMGDASEQSADDLAEAAEYLEAIDA